MNEQILKKIKKITMDKEVIYKNESEDDKSGSKDKLYQYQK